MAPWRRLAETNGPWRRPRADAELGKKFTKCCENEPECAPKRITDDYCFSVKGRLPPPYQSVVHIVAKTIPAITSLESRSVIALAGDSEPVKESSV